MDKTLDIDQVSSLNSECVWFVFRNLLVICKLDIYLLGLVLVPPRNGSEWFSKLQGICQIQSKINLYWLYRLKCFSLPLCLGVIIVKSSCSLLTLIGKFIHRGLCFVSWADFSAICVGYFYPRCWQFIFNVTLYLSKYLLISQQCVNWLTISRHTKYRLHREIWTDIVLV